MGSNVRVPENTRGLELSTSTLPRPPEQSDADSKSQETFCAYTFDKILTVAG